MHFYDTIVLSSLRTGNQFLDSILILLVTSLIGFVVNNKDLIIRKLASVFQTGHCEISVDRVIKDNYCATPAQSQNFAFDSLQWYLSEQSLKSGSFEAIMETSKKCITVIPAKGSRHQLIWNGEHIEVKYRFEQHKGENHMVTVDHGYTLFYRGKTSGLLWDFLKYVKEAHDKHVRESVWRQRYWCTSRLANLQWLPYWSYNNMTFEHIVAERSIKDLIVNDVRKFLSSEELYRKRGNKWCRGYAFHGEPGCGKTSLIRAISNEAKMDIYAFDLSDIRSDQELRQLYRGIPEKSMIVFEDIDANCDMVLDREELKKMKRPVDKNKTLDIEQRESGPGFTLAALLNEMDGIVSRNGCITVITSNHLDRLDPALLRPGRIDVTVELEKSTLEEIAQCYNLYTGENMSPDDLPKDMHKKHTLATICNMVVKGELRSVKDSVTK